jgi:hypothetical protein
VVAREAVRDRADRRPLGLPHPRVRADALRRQVVDLVGRPPRTAAAVSALVVRWTITVAAVLLIVAAIYYACPRSRRSGSGSAPGPSSSRSASRRRRRRSRTTSATSHPTTRRTARSARSSSCSCGCTLLAVFLLLGGELNALLEQRIPRAEGGGSRAHRRGGAGDPGRRGAGGTRGALAGVQCAHGTSGKRPRWRRQVLDVPRREPPNGRDFGVSGDRTWTISPRVAVVFARGQENGQDLDGSRRVRPVGSDGSSRGVRAKRSRWAREKHSRVGPDTTLG